MSFHRKKAGLVISWKKTFPPRLPWKKGKGSTDALAESEVVLTKIKLGSSDQRVSDVSAALCSDPTLKLYPAVCLDSEIPKMCKFESVDSGVELPSRAHSPRSFVLLSRESSCSSTNSDPDKVVPTTQRPECHRSIHSSMNAAAGTPAAVRVGQMNQGSTSSNTTSNTTSKHPDDNTGHCSLQTADDVCEAESVSYTTTRDDSLETYMDQCRRHCEEASSSALGSGLDYLEHICQLTEKIGRLQEMNLRLQQDICRLQRKSRLSKTKEDIFQQHCSCGAAIVAFQEDFHQRSCGHEVFSPSGTLSDLSTIPEAARILPLSEANGLYCNGFTTISLWRTSITPRSGSESEDTFNWDYLKSSESSTWGRMKELVKKIKMKQSNRLGLKASCPQLYRPDLEPVKPRARNIESMVASASSGNIDLPWLQ